MLIVALLFQNLDMKDDFEINLDILDRGSVSLISGPHQLSQVRIHPLSQDTGWVNRARGPGLQLLSPELLQRLQCCSFQELWVEEFSKPGSEMLHFNAHQHTFLHGSSEAPTSHGDMNINQAGYLAAAAGGSSAPVQTPKVLKFVDTAAKMCGLEDSPGCRVV